MARYKFGERSQEQIDAALKAAGEARKEQALLLARVKNGTVSISDLLSDAFEHDRAAQRVHVRTVLAATGMSYPRVDRLMEEIGIAPRRRIGGLGARQKSELLEKMA